jgi:hypothetical protein
VHVKNTSSEKKHIHAKSRVYTQSRNIYVHTHTHTHIYIYMDNLAYKHTYIHIIQTMLLEEEKNRTEKDTQVLRVQLEETRAKSRASQVIHTYVHIHMPMCPLKD